MRRSTLITDLLSVPEASPLAWLPPVRHRSFCPRSLLIGALLLACGCQSSNGLTRLFSSKPKSTEKKSILSIVDQDKAGLPPPSKTKGSDGSLVKLLDRGQSELSAYYQDHSAAHLTEAQRNYQQALAQDEGNAEAHHGLAIVCDLKEDYSSAELHYRAALEQDPNNGKILADLGYCYLLQNRLSESEEVLVQATKLDPHNSIAYKNLACVYGKQGNYNLAESTFRHELNEVEVRQQMAELFPNGRPDMAKTGETAKKPWQRNDAITTDQFKQRMDNAREQSVAEMRDRRTALEAASPPALSFEQQQAEIAKLTQERDEALRLAETRTQQSANTPLYLGNPANQPSGPMPGMQIQPQNGSRPLNADVAQQYAGNQSPSGTSQPQAFQNGRRPRNDFYPNGTSPQFHPNPNGIEQAGSQNQPVGPQGQPIDQAYHVTNQGVDPRTGRPRNGQIQQMEGQGQSQVPNGIGNQSQGGFETDPAGRAARFEDAKRRAAMAGLGGPELMFPIATPEGGNRMAPGSGSTFGGSGFPQPLRMLPMDAAPHDLHKLLEAPSGQMTVDPNNMGMLNSPTGPSFSNPNFQQPLAPQIPLNNPMGSQGTRYSDQTYNAQRPGQQLQDPAHRDIQINPGAEYRALGSAHDYDPRNRVNSELNQYGQSFQHNPAEYNSNGWNQTPTPSYGLPDRPQADSSSQLMGPGWNQQQLSPRITPPPYPGREGQPDYNPQLMQNGNGSQGNDYGNPDYGNDPSSGSSTGAMYSEPAPIYSSGARVPAAYNGGSRATNTYGQSFNGPLITPAAR